MIKIISFFLLFILSFKGLQGSEPKLVELFKNLDKPWSLSFINNDNIILTEKSGKLVHLDLIKKKRKKIKHNLNIL
jgi:quinoprotein glucose dehydrogenase